MAQLPWVKIFAASLEMLMILPEEKTGRVIHAVGRYFKYGEMPVNLDSSEMIVFDRLKENVDESTNTYSATCERNRKNSSRRNENKNMSSGNPVDDERTAGGTPGKTKAETEAEAEAEAEVIKADITPPLRVPPCTHDLDFAQFWEAYPKRVGKQAAKKAFDKVSKTTDLCTILHAIELQKQSTQWCKDGGQFIPNPATWLNQGRWDDETEVKMNGQGKRSDFDDIKIGTVV